MLWITDTTPVQGTLLHQFSPLSCTHTSISVRQFPSLFNGTQTLLCKKQIQQKKTFNLVHVPLQLMHISLHFFTGKRLKCCIYLLPLTCCFPFSPQLNPTRLPCLPFYRSVFAKVINNPESLGFFGHFPVFDLSEVFHTVEQSFLLKMLFFLLVLVFLQMLW